MLTFLSLFIILISVIIWRLKALLVIIILLIGGLITCGGNLLLADMGFGGQYGGDLLIYWAIELFIIFLLSVYFIVYKFPELDINKRKMFYIILGVVGIFSIGVLLFSINYL